MSTLPANRAAPASSVASIAQLRSIPRPRQASATHRSASVRSYGTGTVVYRTASGSRHITTISSTSSERYSRRVTTSSVTGSVGFAIGQ
jgi:hypothetical protein